MREHSALIEAMRAAGCNWPQIRRTLWRLEGGMTRAEHLAREEAMEARAIAEALERERALTRPLHLRLVAGTDRDGDDD